MSCAKRWFTWTLPVFALAALGLFMPNAVLAGIVPTGDVTPYDTSMWPSASGGVIVGGTGGGTVTIDAGSAAQTLGCTLGDQSGSFGLVTVEDNSSWDTGGLANIGNMGQGVCNVIGGGTVNGGISTYIGVQSGGAGTLTVDGPGSLFDIDMGSLFVGDSGSGTLNIMDSGTVNMSGNDQVVIGNLGVGVVNVGGSASTLTGGRTLYVGLWGSGSLNINGGATVDNTDDTSIGRIAGSFGTVTVDGTDSTLTSNANLYVGNEGVGTLNIDNGAMVENTSGTTFVGYESTAAGSSVNFGGATGGTLSTKSLYAAPAQLTGTGTIHTTGLVGDGFGLVFDGSPIKNYTPSGTNVNIIVDMSDSTNVGDLGAGYQGTDALTIQNGTVYSERGMLGYGGSSMGMATVTGASSQWIINSSLCVGYEGEGELSVTEGGYVKSASGVLTDGASSVGMATVDGPGSTWETTGDLLVGNNNDGFLSITNGGFVDVGGAAYLGQGATSVGSLIFGANGGTLSAATLYGDTSTVSGNGTIVIYGMVTDKQFMFDGTGVGSTQLVNGGTTTLYLDLSDSNSAGDLGAGFRGTTGLITIKNGATVYSSEGHWGVNASTSGTVTVTDDATWNASGALYIGELGSGVLTVSDQGAVNAADIYVGKSVSGTLDVTSGGTVSGANGYIGYDAYLQIPMPTGTPAASGAAAVDGSGSLWTNTGSVYVGYGGTGTLDVTGGGTVSGADGYIGYQAGLLGFILGPAACGTVTVDGSGSTWTNTGDLYVGYGGPGILTVSNGGALSSADGYIGYQAGMSLPPSPGGCGTVTVDGSGSTWTNTGSLYVGYGDTGMLTVSNGGALSSADGYIGYQAGAGFPFPSPGGCGTVTVDGSGSTWTNTGSLYVGYGDTGMLTVSNGGMVATSCITKGMQGTGTVRFNDGTLQAMADSTSFMQGLTNVYIEGGGITVDTHGHDVTIAQGLLTDGVGSGGLTKTGNGLLILSGVNTYTGLTTVEAGVLELGSSAQSRVLTAGGADIKGGKLVFNYSGTAPDVLALLDASYGTGDMVPWTTGQFHCSTTGGTDTAHGLGWIDNGSEVTVMYTLYGDSNLDGSVNGSDLNAVLSSYNLSGQVWAGGDFNYDGSVNGSDLNTVLSNYNQSLPASTAAVPEPSTLLLMVLGFAGLLAWRRKFMI